MTATRPAALVTGASTDIGVLRRIVPARTFDRRVRRLNRMPG